MDAHFTITETRKDDPRLKEFEELPEEEKQSSVHFHPQLLRGSEKLEIGEMDLMTAKKAFAICEKIQNEFDIHLACKT